MFSTNPPTPSNASVRLDVNFLIPTKMPASIPELSTSKISPFPRASAIIPPIFPKARAIAEPSLDTMFHIPVKKPSTPLKSGPSKLSANVLPNSFPALQQFFITDIAFERTLTILSTIVPNIFVSIAESLRPVK